MATVIKNNMSAINTLNLLGKNEQAQKKSLQKVSSGQRINSAADDASGYAISEKMRTQIRGLDQDIRNAQNAGCMLKTAEGAVQSTVEILKTFKEKAIDAANDTNTDIDRATIQKELDQFINQIDDNAYVTYNGKILLDGSMGGGGAAGDAHGVILDFMSYLDNANLSAQEAFDQAINYASGGLFQNEKDLQEKFIADMSGGDLLGMCGINLDNKDTGSITGLDAGGEVEKTADSVVPEEGSPFVGDVPTGMSTINGLTVTWPDQSDEWEWPSYASYQRALKDISKALDRQWLKNCMDLIDESYEMNFMEPETSVNSMKVRFESASYRNDLAYVTHHATGGVADSLELTVNIWYYQNINPRNPSGENTGTNEVYLDRVIAHEMTHAIMAANIKNFASLPKHMKEGTAELVHGIDDARRSTIDALAKDNARLKTAIEESKTAPGDDAYAAGYMILRYMAHQAADAEPQKRMVIQIGTKANQAIKIGFSDMRSTALGLKKLDGTTISVASQKKAASSLSVIDRAIQKALNQQTYIGAAQSRLDFTISNLTTSQENTTASDSTMRDADMASEMVEYTKSNILMQSAQSMLAQANQNSSSILSLLQ